MTADTYSERLEAHDKAGEEFANALKRSFPALASRLAENTTICFHGTVKGQDVVCTFEEIKDGKTAPELSRRYEPTSPEAMKRRHLLIEKINASQSQKSERALEAVARAYQIGSPKF